MQIKAEWWWYMSIEFQIYFDIFCEMSLKQIEMLLMLGLHLLVYLAKCLDGEQIKKPSKNIFYL